MKIGIIGAGGIGALYARLWAAAGHDIMLSSRSLEKLAAIVKGIGKGVKAGSPAEAAGFGEAVLLAINYWTVDDAVAAIRPHVAGKLIIDATNPLRHAEGGGVERVIPDDAIAGMVMAAKLPEARIAKSFTSLWTGHVGQHADRAAPKIAMPLSADAMEDRQVVARLVRDAGLVPVELGPLAESRPLDPPSPIWNVVLTAEELEGRVAAIRKGEAG